ncbi:MAG: acyltransferase family protein [Methanobrevibacter sp.]|nr:acyltransferase family protein [Methanobrevibacter sp.]
MINNLRFFRKETMTIEGSRRLFKYDNIKGLAIILIVFLHISTPFWGIDFFSGFGLRDIGKLIIPIAMSLFCFTSGYFSKVDENIQIKAFKNVFVPYILFCTLWIIFGIIVFGYNLPKSPYLTPTRGLWYLLVLFYFRFSLPALLKIKHTFLISIIGALAIGLINIESSFLAITRAFCYLPIFLAGYYFKNSEDYLNSLNNTIRNILVKVRDCISNHKKLVLGVLLGFTIILFFIYSHLPFGFFVFKYSYAQMDLTRNFGILMRLFGLFANLGVIILIVYAMPNKGSFLTKIGKNSLYIYVLHFYFSEISKKILKFDSMSYIASNPLFALIYCILVTIILLIILSSNPVEKLIEKFLTFVTKTFVKN